MSMLISPHDTRFSKILSLICSQKEELGVGFRKVHIPFLVISHMTMDEAYEMSVDGTSCGYLITTPSDGIRLEKERWMSLSEPFMAPLLCALVDEQSSARKKTVETAKDMIAIEKRAFLKY